ETQGPRREGAGAHQLAHLARARRAEGLHVEAEALALALAAPHRQVRVAEDEAADDVGAAGDRLQGPVGQLALHPVVLALVEDGSRRQDGPQRVERTDLHRMKAGALAVL